MRRTIQGLSFLLAILLISGNGYAQRRHSTKHKAVPKTEQQPNVSGTPAYITPPSINQAAPQPQPEINVDVKRERKVRVVPAPPPPGPIAPPIPPKE